MVGAPIAFICAMPMEAEPLVERLGLLAHDVAGLKVERGMLGEREVVAMVTGMGPARARAGTERLLDAVTVERVVVVGITGALESTTPIGTLVVPEVVVDGATGAEYRPAPLGDTRPKGRMWTSDHLITASDRLDELMAAGVVSLDMETAAIAAVCERRGVLWSVFRVISDRAGDITEAEFQLTDLDCTPRPEAIKEYFARHPDRIPAMEELAKGAQHGAERAAEEAIRACSAA